MNINHKKAFSLIELLVSMAIFTMVVTMAVGTLLVLVDANAKAQNMETVMANVSFVMENMTREIRTGRSLVCINDPSFYNNESSVEGLATDDTRDCLFGPFLSLVEGGSSLTGVGNPYPRIAYRLNANDGTIERKVSDDNWLPLTSSSVVITDLYFKVDGTDATNNDIYQPVVRIWIRGHAGDLPEVSSTFILQTTVTKQVVDFNLDN